MSYKPDPHSTTNIISIFSFGPFLRTIADPLNFSGDFKDQIFLRISLIHINILFAPSHSVFKLNVPVHAANAAHYNLLSISSLIGLICSICFATCIPPPSIIYRHGAVTVVSEAHWMYGVQTTRFCICLALWHRLNSRFWSFVSKKRADWIEQTAIRRHGTLRHEGTTLIDISYLSIAFMSSIKVQQISSGVYRKSLRNMCLYSRNIVISQLRFRR